MSQKEDSSLPNGSVSRFRNSLKPSNRAGCRLLKRKRKQERRD